MIVILVVDVPVVVELVGLVLGVVEEVVNVVVEDVVVELAGVVLDVVVVLVVVELVVELEPAGVVVTTEDAGCGVMVDGRGLVGLGYGCLFELALWYMIGRSAGDLRFGGSYSNAPSSPKSSF